MDNLTQAVEQALENRSWHAALALSLALPDICGKIDDANAGSQVRYVKWFDTYVGHKYKRAGTSTSHTFLSGADCYALRCAYLHEGVADIIQQRARQVLEGFRFIVSPPGWHIHCNQMNNKLQLDVKQFCEDIVEGVRAWRTTHPNIPFDNLLVIEEIDISQGFSL